GDARTLLYQLARREGSLAEQVRLAERLLPCSDGPSTLASLVRDRGDLRRAEELDALLAAARPAQPGRLHQLAEVQAARGRIEAARRSLQAAAGVAPRSAE